jgi:PAS domain S-box-containing protein
MTLKELYAAGKRWAVHTTLGAIVLAFILLALLGYRSIDRELTDAALSRRASISYLAAATLSEKFDRLIDIGVSLAIRPRVRELIGDGKWAEAGEFLEDIPANFSFIDRLFLTDASGTVMLDIPELPGARGKNFAYRDWYQGVSRNWEPYISPVYKRAAAPQYNVFAVAVPIRDKNNKVLGILLLQSRLDVFSEWTKNIGIGQGGVVYIIDNKGQIAFHPKFSPQGEIVDFSKNPITRLLLRGDTGVDILRDPVSGKESVLAFASAKHGWGVVAEQPASTAFLIKNSQLRDLWIGYALILLLCAVVVYLASRLVVENKKIDEERDRFFTVSLDMLCIAKSDGYFKHVSPAFTHTLGWSVEELLARPFLDFVHPDDRAATLREVEKQVVAGESVLQFENRYQHKDGSWRILSWMSMPQPGGMMYATARDVTERHRFERALQEKNVELANANQAKDRFLATMSHELRTPMNAIIGFTGTLLMKLPGPLNAEQNKQLSTIQSSARHLLSLINDLLDLAKIDAGKVELHLEPTDCKAVVEDVVTTLRPRAEDKGLALRVTLPDQALTISADRRALSQIIINLANNAIKFTERGSVHLKVSPGEANGRRMVEFSVEDTGIGILPEDQLKLFAAFAQVDAQARRSREGTGLGLHLSQKLAELLGGKITFRSEYGKGSTFTLALKEA